MSKIKVAGGQLAMVEKCVIDIVWDELAPLVRNAIGDIHLYDRGYRPSEHFNGSGAHCHREDRRLCFVRQCFTVENLRHEAMHAGFFKLCETRGWSFLEAQWLHIAGRVVFTSEFRLAASSIFHPIRFPICGLLDAYSCGLMEDVAQFGAAILSQAAGEASALLRIKDREGNKDDARFFKKALCLRDWGLIKHEQFEAALPCLA